MSDEYFHIAMDEIRQQAEVPKPVDPRLSDDPLTALAAVMRHHKINLNVSAEGSGLFQPTLSIDCEDIYGDLFSFTGFAPLTADDIKPESKK